MHEEAQVLDLLARGDQTGAATVAIRGFGPAVLGYLTAVLKDEDDARDAFSSFAEDLWRGLPGFRGECSMRAWVFRLAWHAASRLARDSFRRRRRPLPTSAASRLAASVQTMSSALPGSRKERMLKLRESLDPEERTLLILRLDRELAWEEVAQVFSSEGGPVATAALRKRFERLKEKLARKAKEEGLLE
jgi:RNA polymerase sigma-70 factor, ECF subfamily